MNLLDPRPAACEKAMETWGTDVQPPKPQAAKTPTAATLTARSLTEGQRAYEAKRAAKAGMSLDKWLTSNSVSRRPKPKRS
jgi:hypothetical protein